MLKKIATYSIACILATSLVACCCGALADLDVGEESKKTKTKGKKKKQLKKKKSKKKPPKKAEIDFEEDIIGRWECESIIPNNAPKKTPCSKLYERLELKITAYFRYDFGDLSDELAKKQKNKKKKQRGAYNYEIEPTGKKQFTMKLGNTNSEKFEFKDQNTLLWNDADATIVFRRTEDNPSGPVFPVRWAMGQPKKATFALAGEGKCNKEGNILVCNHEPFGPFSYIKTVFENGKTVGITVDLAPPSEIDFNDDALAEFGLNVETPDKQNKFTKTWNSLHGWDEVRMMVSNDDKTLQRLRIQNYKHKLD